MEEKDEKQDEKQEEKKEEKEEKVVQEEEGKTSNRDKVLVCTLKAFD